jgi:hypothetical protein
LTFEMLAEPSRISLEVEAAIGDRRVRFLDATVVSAAVQARALARSWPGFQNGLGGYIEVRYEIRPGIDGSEPFGPPGWELACLDERGREYREDTHSYLPSDGPVTIGQLRFQPSPPAGAGRITITVSWPSESDVVAVLTFDSPRLPDTEAN